MNHEIPDQNPEKESAFKKAKEFGQMSLTAKEHKLIGSTPPEKLVENPGKNSFDLMSDEEIKTWAQRESAGIRQLEGLVGKGSLTYESVAGDFEAGVNYLKSIGRLPEGFENLGG